MLTKIKKIPHEALMQSIRAIARICRFIASCIRLRSISAAIWIDAYDNAGGKS